MKKLSKMFSRCFGRRMSFERGIKIILWNKELGRKAMERAELFFVALQYAAKGYIALNATKTGTVYRLLGNPPKSHE